MKNVFGYPYVKDRESRCDGERFITERVDAGFKQELDKAVGEVMEMEEKTDFRAGQSFCPAYAFSDL